MRVCRRWLSLLPSGGCGRCRSRGRSYSWSLNGGGGTCVSAEKDDFLADDAAGVAPTGAGFVC